MSRSQFARDIMAERFAQEYAITLDATEAAQRAGSKAQSRKQASDAARRLMLRPEVRARINEVCKERLDRTKVTTDWVVMNLREIVLRCMQTTQVYDAEGNPTGVYVFDAKNGLRALELLMRHMGMLQERPEDVLGEGGAAFGVIMMPAMRAPTSTPLPENPSLQQKMIRSPMPQKLPGALQRKFMELMLEQNGIGLTPPPPEPNGHEVASYEPTWPETNGSKED